MKLKQLYQTVEDRDNPSFIASHGPFLCSRGNAWLGEGYYFWDSFIELSHWWGNTVYEGNYVIVQSACCLPLADTYDLYDDFECLQEFSCLKDALKEKLHKDSISVSDVLAFLKSNSDFMDRYKAIRAKATGCMKHAPSLKFVNYNKAFLELMPPVQFCVLDKAFLYKNQYTIVYPSKYV